MPLALFILKIQYLTVGRRSATATLRTVPKFLQGGCTIRTNDPDNIPVQFHYVILINFSRGRSGDGSLP
jgi:hypothetical protein